MAVIQEFEITPKKVTEGEMVTVRWSCDLPDSVMLSVQGGGTPVRTQLADSGTRTFYATEPGTMTFKLTVSSGGRLTSEEQSVQVKALKTIKAEKVGRESNSSKSSSSSFSFGGLRQKAVYWFQSLGRTISGFFQRLAYGWASMPEKKRRIWKFVIYLVIAMWLAAIFQNRGYRQGYEKGIHDAQHIEGIV